MNFLADEYRTPMLDKPHVGRRVGVNASGEVDAVPTVFVVDDDEAARKALETLIRLAGWRPRCFSSAQDFLACPRVLSPTCVILDFALPDLHGLALQGLIAHRTELPVIFVTDQYDVPLLVRAMKAGAIEFLTKPFAAQALVSAVREGLHRSHCALVHETEVRTLINRFELLSGREREVLALVVEGRLNKQIAGALGISEITVKVHRGSVMRKMAAGSLADLVRMAGRIHISRPATPVQFKWSVGPVPLMPPEQGSWMAHLEGAGDSSVRLDGSIPARHVFARASM